jgi:glycosyltransferase involved in cell wall biosynthesis
MSRQAEKDKKKIIFVLPHSFESFFPKIKQDINNIRELDHFSTRYIDFMQTHSGKYEFELWVLSSKIKKTIRIIHRKGFPIIVFPRDLPLFLPLETSRSMLKEMKKRAEQEKGIIWHINSYYLIMSDSISRLLHKKHQNFALHHRGGGFSLKALPYSIYKYGIMNRLNFRMANLVIAENRDEEQRLINSYKVPADKVIYAPNPVEIIAVKQGKALLRRKLNLPLDKKIIIYAGRLMKGKGVVLLMNSMKKYLKDNKDILFIMLGDGKARLAIEKIIKREKIYNAKVISWVARKKIFEYYAASDLFIHPNKNTKFEGTPNALIEAQGSGLPIAGFNVGGVRDVVKDGYSGYLERSMSIDEFAKEAIFLVKNQDKLLQLGKNAMKNYKKNYHANKTLKTYLLMYDLLSKEK